MFITDSTMQAQCDPGVRWLPRDAGAEVLLESQAPRMKRPSHIHTLCSPPHRGQREVRRGPRRARVGKRCVQSSPGRQIFIFMSWKPPAPSLESGHAAARAAARCICLCLHIIILLLWLSFLPNCEPMSRIIFIYFDFLDAWIYYFNIVYNPYNST